MPGSTIADVSDALYEALLAAPELDDVDVWDGYPNPDKIRRESVIVGDIPGDQEPATMRAGGGTRDETYAIEIHIAVVHQEDRFKPVVTRAIALAQVVERVVHDATAQGTPLGVDGVRQLLVRGQYDVRKFTVDRGREVDVRMRVEVKARVPR